MLERTFVNTNPAPDLSDQLWHTYGFGQSLSELSQAQKGRMTAQTDEYKRLEKLAPHDGQAAAMVNHVNAWPIRVGRAAVGMMDAFTRLKLDGAIATTKQLIGTPTGAMLQQRH